MKLAVVVSVAAVLLGVTGLCRADEQVGIMPLSEGVGQAERTLKAVLYDFIGNQFVGSVAWHTDNVVSPRRPPTLAVRADIEIPDAGITVRLDLRRNNDKSLPASHTIKIAFTLPPDLPHREIANVPGILMKAGETTRGGSLNGAVAKVTDNVFLIGLSLLKPGMQRNIQLMKERSWVDIPMAYSDGSHAVLLIEKGTLSERALSVLAPPVQADHVATPTANAPPDLAQISRIVSLITVDASSRANLAPPSTEDAFKMAAVAFTPPSTPGAPWSKLPLPDLRLPTGPSRLAHSFHLEPPAEFVRWTDRLEEVLPADKASILEVDRRCRALGAETPPSKIIRGCAYRVALPGRCFIIRVDDPGVARHELAHCNGWKHPRP